jgi:hypothetical protein
MHRNQCDAVGERPGLPAGSAEVIGCGNSRPSWATRNVASNSLPFAAGPLTISTDGALARIASRRSLPIGAKSWAAARCSSSRWEAIYQDNAIWVYRMLYAKVGNRPDAEDLTDEVFLAALRPLRVSATAPEVRAYLRRASATSPTRPNAGHRAPGAARMCAADQLLNNSGLVTPCAPSAPVGR